MFNSGFFVFILIAIFIPIIINVVNSITKEANKKNTKTTSNVSDNNEMATITPAKEKEEFSRKKEGFIRQEMHSHLIEPEYVDYVPIKSRNEELFDTEYDDDDPSSSSDISDEPYSGSLGVYYAGNGCEDSCAVRYISDYSNPADEEITLTSLQKFIVFGEVINKPKFKQINKN